MSSPIDPSHPHDGVSPYAPKWAREADDVSKEKDDTGPRLPRIDPNELANALNTDVQPERARAAGPTLVPEPPLWESERRGPLRYLLGDNSGAGTLARVFLIIFVAALVAIMVVVLLPGRGLLTAQYPVATSPAAPDRAPSTVGSGSFAKESAQAVASRSDREPIKTRHKAATPPAPGPEAERPPASAPVKIAAVPPPTQEMAPAPVAPAVKPAPAPVAPMTAPLTDKPASGDAGSSPAVQAAPAQPAKPVRSLGADEIKTLLEQGEEFVSVGDFASARTVFGRVWEANEARGALALAKTYDPVDLAKIGAKGVTPDVTKAREWYAKAGELGSREAAARLQALGKGTSAFASQDAATPPQHRVAAAGPASTNVVSAAASDPSGVVGSYWRSGDSIMRLEAAGVSRKFFYFKPSDDESQTGAKTGSPRFTGQISGKTYVGTAYVYSDKCGRAAFRVVGQIENDGGRVILSGKGPQFDEACREIGKTDQKLVFDVVGAPEE
ncbi:MAG TPA: hypothetical protein VFP60_01465 [Pseudolabrys sp.]|nr:hypothetical protein [Pseudolabrys sp.]